METDFSQVEKYLLVLEETILRIQVLEDGLDNADLQKEPGDGEWSARGILAHLHSCQEVWGYSIFAMLISSEPTLAHIHPRAWTKRMRYDELSFAEIFDAFASRRVDLLRIVEQLNEEEWSSGAAINGRRHTVYSQIRRMAKHEEEHWPQLEVFLD
jgi:hypothetical protein